MQEYSRKELFHPYLFNDWMRKQWQYQRNVARIILYFSDCKLFANFQETYTLTKVTIVIEVTVLDVVTTIVIVTGTPINEIISLKWYDKF